MWLVMLKEIKELIRDKKTMFFMIALPVLVFPVIIGLATFVGAKAVESAKQEVLSFAVIGENYAPEFIEEVTAIEGLELVSLPSDTDASSWVKSGDGDFVIEVPENWSSDSLQSGQITLKVYLNDAGLNMVMQRLREVVEKYEEGNQMRAFEALALNETQQQALIDPIKIEKVNVADERENIGAQIGGMVPYFIFILCLQGAMIPATDLGAGEKERGTLETLLLSPLPRHQLVMGKFFTIAFAGVMSALVTVASMAIWGIVLSQGMAIAMLSDFLGQIGVIDYVLIFLMLVPVVAMFASILLTLSIYARSFKEAQAYMTPLVFLVIIPVIFSMLPGVELKGAWAWVPLTNVALAIKELIKGTMDYVQLVAIFGSTAAIAGACIAFCVYWFGREKVLFR